MWAARQGPKLKGLKVEDGSEIAPPITVIDVCRFKTVSGYVAQAGLKLLSSSNQPAPAS